MEKIKNLVRDEKFCIFLLIVLALVGYYIRVIGLNKPDGMWTDEVFCYYEAKQSFPLGILHKLIVEDIHAPIYYFILHFWMKMFGEADITLRFLSVIFGVLSIPAFYLAGKELSSKRAGLYAASLACVNSFLIFYSQEVKFYSMLTLLGALSIYFLAKIRNLGKVRDYTGLVITNLIILYTFSFGCAFVFFEALVFLIYLYLKDKSKLKGFIISQAITLAIFSPFIIAILYFMQKSAEGFANSMDWYSIDLNSLQVMFQFWFSPIFKSYTFQDILNAFMHNGDKLALLIFYIIPVAIFGTGLFKAIKKKDFASMVLLFSLLFVLLEFILALMGKFPLRNRHAMLAFPGIILAISYGLAELKNRKLATALVSFLVITSLWYIISNPMSAPKIGRDDPYNIPAVILDKFPIDNRDTVLMPFNGKLFGKYFNKTNIYDLKNELDFVFSPVEIASLNRNNSFDKLKGYILSNTVPQSYEDYVKTSIIDNIEEGRYLVIIKSQYYGPFTEKNFTALRTKQDIYKTLSLNFMLNSKTYNDLTRISSKYMTPVYVEGKQVWQVLVFQKQKNHQKNNLPDFLNTINQEYDYEIQLKK